jgi:hypothetical protein
MPHPCQAPGLLPLLQSSGVAQGRDVFFINFGRWHFFNCLGLQEDSYRQALQQLGEFYQVCLAAVYQNY